MNVTYGKFDLSNYKNNLIVTDANIAKLYNIVGNNVYLLPQGESAKSFEHVEALCKWFLANNLDKNGRVVAVGGGSIGDTVGFATSIYKRGVNVLHVPTTLIAQIDSSIGGKTAVNLGDVKNAVGSYHFGDTLIDYGFLKTLDGEQMKSGWGEIIKYAMLDKSVQKFYADGDVSLPDIISECVRCKRRICEIDPQCNGERNKLNFGHTIGHALELTYGIPHGVAVANGIYYETLLALRLGKCAQAYADKWMGEVKDNFQNIYPLNKKIVSLMLQDKKNADGKVCFVLPEAFEKEYLTLEKVEELLLNA